MNTIKSFLTLFLISSLVLSCGGDDSNSSGNATAQNALVGNWNEYQFYSNGSLYIPDPGEELLETDHYTFNSDGSLETTDFDFDGTTASCSVISGSWTATDNEITISLLGDEPYSFGYYFDDNGDLNFTNSETDDNNMVFNYRTVFKKADQRQMCPE